MRNTGAIEPAQYEQAVDRDLHLKPGRLYTRIREPYFFSYVYNELVREYGAATVRSGGLRVYTTVDRKLQLAATKAIRDTLRTARTRRPRSSRSIRARARSR